MGWRVIRSGLTRGQAENAMAHSTKYLPRSGGTLKIKETANGWSLSRWFLSTAESGRLSSFKKRLGGRSNG